MQLHLDLMGGLAGDMFVGCVLDAFPEHTPRVLATVALLARAFGESSAACRLVRFNDGVFSGSRFAVEEAKGAEAPGLGGAALPQAGQVGHLEGASPPAAAVGDHGELGEHVHRSGHADQVPHASHEPHVHEGAGHAQAHSRPDAHSPPLAHSHSDPQAFRHAQPHVHSHAHVAWAEIRATLNRTLEAGTLRHAVGIFGVLAEAEARVHGVAVDAVEFHEVGAWDSIADIAAAACLIDALDARRWSVSAVPLGAGRVRTAHGVMPVPPPATALLLRGFETLDDGIAGERVTPTGAAILAYLLPGGSSATPAAARSGATPRVLRRSGVGFGTRRLPGISNCVRLLAFDDEWVSQEGVDLPQHRDLAVIEFEVDDQSAEDLAVGLNRLRDHEAVFDVVQSAVFGKKGRMMTSVRLLARPTALDPVIEACFTQTTTIGLRHTTVRGAALPRRSDQVEVDGHRFRVKTVDRPGGATAKAESDDALPHETHRTRRHLRTEAERLALAAAEGGAS